MIDDLFARWTQLWDAGVWQVWRDYTAAQKSILAMGRELVGQTPADVIYTEDHLRLLHYHPQVASPLPVPVLCVPSLINQYYVMDLIPERSLVGYLLAQGLDVYMLDWGTATEADRCRTMDEYIGVLLRRVVQVIQRATGQPTVSLLGYCMGGMMSLVYAALFPAEIANLVNLAGPINYHDDGIYSVWTRPEWFDVDLLVDTVGNIPAALLNATFHMVRPTNELIQAFNYRDRQHDEAFMRRFAAMQIWLNDPIPFPGEVFRSYIKDLYQQNLLLKGEWLIGGQKIDPRAVTTPTLTIAARYDHIAPWSSVAVLDDLIASLDKQCIVLEKGHIGMVIGSDSHSRLWPQLSAWLSARST
ncbi:MAG TPA: alpha/beta fold hydrolase [Aggregatilineaceae bacterium]|nr:alpha/beta fold hydrolase [Aggregatilineaceae bacterium]